MGKKWARLKKAQCFYQAIATSPYDFYQYWINVTDNDVIKFLKLYTFLELDEIKKYETLKNEELRFS